MIYEPYVEWRTASEIVKLRDPTGVADHKAIRLGDSNAGASLALSRPMSSENSRECQLLVTINASNLWTKSELAVHIKRAYLEIGAGRVRVAPSARSHVFRSTEFFQEIEAQICFDLGGLDSTYLHVSPFEIKLDSLVSLGEKKIGIGRIVLVDYFSDTADYYAF